MINVLGLGRSVFISWHSGHKMRQQLERGDEEKGSKGKRKIHSYSHLSLSAPKKQQKKKPLLSNLERNSTQVEKNTSTLLKQ